MSSTNKTEKLMLNLWEADDKPKRQDFNEDNIRLEAAITEHSENSSLHVTEALTERMNTLEGAAAAAEEKIGAHAEDASIHMTAEQIAALGKKPQVYRYTGDGSESRRHTLPFAPSVVIIFMNAAPPVNYGPHIITGTGEGMNYFCGIVCQDSNSSLGSSFGLTINGKSFTTRQSQGPINNGVSMGGFPCYNVSGKNYCVILFP